MRLFRRKKGQLAIMVVLFISLIILVIVGSVMSAMGMRFTVASYAVAEDIIDGAQVTLAQINNTDVRNYINGTFTQATDNTEEAVDIFSAGYRYLAIVAVIVVSLTAFLSARKTVETGSIV